MGQLWNFVASGGERGGWGSCTHVHMHRENKREREGEREKERKKKREREERERKREKRKEQERKREREGGKTMDFFKVVPLLRKREVEVVAAHVQCVRPLWMFVCGRVCVFKCVCVRERERENERKCAWA